jgi:hypothetical protein
MDEAYYLQEMKQEAPGIFDQLDGWATHSYPNHGFIGSADDIGRHSIRGYEWEEQLLKSLGLNKNLPIYITETGWPHKEGLKDERLFYDSNKVAQLIEKAFNLWEKDNRIISVTPFVLNYPAEPFDHFSWLSKELIVYDQFNRITAMTKTAGLPSQVETYEITKLEIADLLPTNYNYKVKLTFKNTGQWIMGERGEVDFGGFLSGRFMNSTGAKLAKGDLIYPGEKRTLSFELRTGVQSATQHIVIAEKDYTIYIFKPWDLKDTKVSLWQQIVTRVKLWWGDFKQR